MSNVRYIRLHDVFGVSQRQFDRGHTGSELLVRYDAIDTMRSYNEGVVRTIVGVHGAFHHVSETADDIRAKIDKISQGY